MEGEKREAEEMREKRRRAMREHFLLSDPRGSVCVCVFVCVFLSVCVCVWVFVCGCIAFRLSLFRLPV